VTQAWYNIVVVGTDLSGLMYGALAARLGYRVAVIGQGALPNAYRKGRFVFLRQAERFLGFSTSPAVSKVFSELSLGIEMKNRPAPLDPALQLVLPDLRLDVAGHRRRWEQELARELPGSADAFDRFERWAADATRASDAALEADIMYPPTGLRGKSAYRKVVQDFDDLLDVGGRDVLAELLGDRTLRALALGPLTHLSGLLAQPLSPLSVARLWTHLRAGMYRVPGGLDGLKQIFIRKIREQSSDYRPDAAVDHVTIRRGKVHSVVLSDRGEELGCELVVGNIEPRQFLSLVPRDQRHDSFHASLAGLQPAGWRFTINLGLNEKVIPEGMAADVVMVADPAERMRGENSLWFSRPGHGPYAGTDSRPGPGVIQISALLQSRGAAPTIGNAKRLIERTLERTRQLIPWLDEHLEVVDAPAVITDPATGRMTLDLQQLAPVMGRALPGTLGSSPFAAATSYRNILLCGDLLFAGLGFEGMCLAAQQTLTLTRQLVRLKSALRSDRQLS
jgi:phytoene dehydrogenase-like protein